jgi:hypothetical protein
MVGTSSWRTQRKTFLSPVTWPTASVSCESQVRKLKGFSFVRKVGLRIEFFGSGTTQSQLSLFSTPLHTTSTMMKGKNFIRTQEVRERILTVTFLGVVGSYTYAWHICIHIVSALKRNEFNAFTNFRRSSFKYS